MKRFQVTEAHHFLITPKKTPVILADHSLIFSMEVYNSIKSLSSSAQLYGLIDVSEREFHILSVDVNSQIGIVVYTNNSAQMHTLNYFIGSLEVQGGERYRQSSHWLFMKRQNTRLEDMRTLYFNKGEGDIHAREIVMKDMRGLIMSKHF